MQNMQPMTDNFVIFDKKIYALDAIFRAIVDSRCSNHVTIEEDSKNYIALFDKLISLEEKQKLVGDVNVQMVKIKLEEKFESIRKIIVDRALSVNKELMND